MPLIRRLGSVVAQGVKDKNGSTCISRHGLVWPVLIRNMRAASFEAFEGIFNGDE